MAALTSANVRTIKAWTEGAVTGKRRKVRRVEVYNGSWGGSTNTLLASAFGLSVIEEVTPGLYDSHAYVAVPTSDGSAISLFATVGAASAPADVTAGDTPNGLYFTVKGY
jgi:hypothetical protein